jgi:opacity protein-like surface antigen
MLAYNLQKAKGVSVLNQFKLLPIYLVTMLLASAQAFAFDDSFSPYIGVIVGTPITSVNKLSDATGSLETEFNPGLLGGLTAGASMNTNFGYNIDRIRLEAEAAYRTNELVKMNGAQGQRANVNGTVSVTNYMLNGYLENSNFVTKEMPVSLFLTAGAGAAIATISEISYRGRTLVASGKNTQLAYQGGLGVGTELTKNITIDLSYKYMGTTPFNFSGVSATYGSHNILLGARYSFY